MSRGTFWDKKLSRKIKLFDDFRSLTGKYFGFSAKTFRQICQKGILRVLGNVLRKFFGKRTYIFFTNSRFWANNFGLSAKVSSRLIKTEFNGSRRLFLRLFWENTSSSSLLHFEQKNKSTFGGKFSVGLSHCYILQGNTSEEIFSENYNFPFRFIDFERSSFFATFDKNNSEGLLKLQFTSTEERFDVVFWESEFFSWFSDFTCRKISNFCRKKFGKLVKNANWVSRGWIQGKKLFEEDWRFWSFSYFEWKQFGLLAKKFSRAFKTAVYVYRGTFQYCFSEKISFHLFWTLSAKQ